jgi:hypothetical protein
MIGWVGGMCVEWGGARVRHLQRKRHVTQAHNRRTAAQG